MTNVRQEIKQLSQKKYDEVKFWRRILIGTIPAELIAMTLFMTTSSKLFIGVFLVCGAVMLVAAAMISIVEARYDRKAENCKRDYFKKR